MKNKAELMDHIIRHDEFIINIFGEAEKTAETTNLT